VLQERGLGSRPTLALRRAWRLEVNQLWLQEQVNNGEIEIEKVMGIINRADALTKPKHGKTLLQHVEWTSQEVTKGGHMYAPKLRKVDPVEKNNEDDEP